MKLLSTLLVASAAAATNAATSNANAVTSSDGEINFRYFFGARCPYCRSFGTGDYLKIYQDFGTDDSIDFRMIPAVRDPAGACIEETDCSWETVAVCGFNQTSTADATSFLACLDGRDASDATQAALNAGKHCAPASNVDVTKLSTCYHGQQGKDLLQAASVEWNKQFPERGTVPHTFVDTTDVQADYSDLKDALCKAGSRASVCKGVATEPKEELCWA